MIVLGGYNTLRVIKEVDFGIYLDGLEQGEILMPKRYVPEGCKPEDELEVFLYFDSEDRLIATTEKPLATVNSIALLEVVSVTTIGAFLNWGLMKDLLLPYAEQKRRPDIGDKIMVYVYLDTESGRLAASAKIERYVNKTPPVFEENEEVDLQVYEITDLGFKAIINNTHTGIIYKNEVFKNLAIGDKTKGFIKKVRDDDKIDLMLQKPGFEKIDQSVLKIIDYLKANGGSMPFNDKSDSGEIQKVFGISKKTFKKALGGLYKQKKISITEKGVTLIEP